MGKIVILDEVTSNQIAAGEVVERPASVAKEMIENSLDAGATSITVEIENGGISLFKITDNGFGMAKDDMVIAFERHATSKIRKTEDLNVISSFGFRGEALASIASVAEVEVTSRTKDSDTGYRVVIKGGNLVSEEEVAAQVGTTFTVRNLFYNTPARYKFLKKDYTEAGYIEDIISKIALVNPKVAFKFINNKKTIIQTTGDGNILNCIYNIFGKDIAKSIVPFREELDGIVIEGALGKEDISRSNRSNEIFFVNERYIKNKTLTSAVENAYQTIIPIGKFPYCIINVKMPATLVDVNVHPTKTEVRFADEGLIYRAVYHVVKEKMLKQDLVPEVKEKEEEAKPTFTYTETKSSNSSFSYTMPKSSGYNSLYENKPVTYGEPKRDLFISKPVDIKERNESIFSKVEEEKNYKIVGVAFSTYVIIEQNGEMYIIDQHAAHERVMYEKLLKKVREGIKNKQMLMIPEVVEVKNNELYIIKTNIELFNQAGFELEEFGGNSVKISAVPSEITGIAIKDLFLELLDSLQKESGVIENDKAEYFIFTMACKAAVKANMNLNIVEIEALISEMMKLENPFTCPHGRPTAIKMTKYELEKKFKRT